MKSVSNSTDAATYSIVAANGNVTTFEIDLGSVLTVPGNAQGLVTIGDGGQFTLTQNGRSVVFEFDSDALFSTGAIPISFSANETPAVVVGRMIAAIQSAGLIVSANALSGNRVQIIGSGIVLSNLTANLQLAGANGVIPGSIAIPLDASVVTTASAVAQAVADAIRNAGIAGVTVSNVGNNVLIDGAAGVVGEGATVVQTITDRAGNALRSNQSDGSTVLTIQIGAGFDYGDAPDPIYATKKTSNGPRHNVVDGYHLGVTVGADADAQTNNGDTDDGVAFNQPIVQGFATQVVVTAAGISLPDRPGYLSAWIDFDRDGQFEDSERITTSSNDTLSIGANNISFVVPGSSVPGATYARFRYSSTRNLSPLGEAPDGEVEDHLVTIAGNPYRNQSNNLDVNADGSVSPIDVLQIINFLSRSGSSSVQLVFPANRPVPPFVDVNGDGFASPIDILQVINAINRATRGAAEGEAAPSGDTWVAASSVQSSVASQVAPPISTPVTPPTTPTTNATPAVREDSAWVEVGSSDNNLDAAWFNDDELDPIAVGTSENQSVPPIHDNVFAGLDDDWS